MSRFTHLLTRSTKSARETFVRFPASIMAAIIVTGIFLYLSRDMSGNFDSSQPVLRVAVVGVYFVFMSVAITLLSESY